MLVHDVHCTLLKFLYETTENLLVIIHLKSYTNLNGTENREYCLKTENYPVNLP